MMDPGFPFDLPSELDLLVRVYACAALPWFALEEACRRDEPERAERAVGLFERLAEPRWPRASEAGLWLGDCLAPDGRLSEPGFFRLSLCFDLGGARERWVPGGLARELEPDPLLGNLASSRNNLPSRWWAELSGHAWPRLPRAQKDDVGSAFADFEAAARLFDVARESKSPGMLRWLEAVYGGPPPCP